jgi:hypothetical protein
MDPWYRSFLGCQGKSAKENGKSAKENGKSAKENGKSAKENLPRKICQGKSAKEKRDIFVNYLLSKSHNLVTFSCRTCLLYATSARHSSSPYHRDHISLAYDSSCSRT